MEERLTRMEKNKIEHRADRVLKAFDYNDSEDSYVDAVRLAMFFGFIVDEKDMPANEDGCVSVSENQKEKNIEVNTNRSIETKRFIITHELAHYLLHYSGEKSFFMHRENTKGKNLEENDADYLAACLLMPTKSFKKEFDILKRNKYTYEEIVKGLQKVFRTPRESIERRINEVCM